MSGTTSGNVGDDGGTSAPGDKGCTHDWRIVDTLINRMHGPDKNPTFNLKCRKCGAEKQVQGQAALKGLVNQAQLGTGLG